MNLFRSLIVFVLVCIIVVAVLYSPTVVIDDLDDISTTDDPYCSPGSYGEIKSVPGNVNNGVNLSYDLDEGGYAGFCRPINRLQEFKALRYYYKCDGAQNTIEMKLVDINNNNFRNQTRNAVPKDKWTPTELTEEDFKCWSGSPLGSNPDLNKIWQIEFAVSNNKGDTAGKGFFVIDQVEGVKKSLLDRIIEWFMENQTLASAIITVGGSFLIAFIYRGHRPSKPRGNGS